MEKNTREKISNSNQLYLFGLRFKYGIKNILSNKKVLVVYCAFILIEILIYNYIFTNIYKEIDFLEKTAPIFLDFKVCILIIVLIFIAISAILFIGTPLNWIFQKKGFQKIGFVNSARLTPVLIKQEKNYENVFKFEYYSNGIPFIKFKDSRESIEAALNISIIDIYQGRDKTRVIITARKGNECLPDIIKWDDSYISNDSAEIVLGKNIGGFKIINLNSTPHIQCGGSTGSGKTVLLKCVLNQLYKNKVDIYLCDFKGFVDFNNDVKSKYKCLETKAELLATLEYLVNEMEYRKKLFSSVNCENIEKYNNKFPENKIKRIFLASDEIAYAFQKKGLTKADKEIVEAIGSNMTLIAQQGRFAGINLWLSTQRGDADTIPPQIRSNMTVRICGKASEILSRVTIDNSLASEIPSHIKGRFVEDNEEMFQGFYYEGD